MLKRILKQPARAAICLALTVMLVPQFAFGAEELSGFDLKVFQIASGCRDKILEQMKMIVGSGRISKNQLFDTFYIPIPKTDPQKYHTQYDKQLDNTIQDILDTCLVKDKRIKFVVAVDKNGYLPTHNSKYSKPMTGDPRVDVKQNRTKRIFNDRTGLAAARNEEKVLIQKYSRDTGEQMADLSVPISIYGRHWGALRIGYSPK